MVKKLYCFQILLLTKKSSEIRLFLSLNKLKKNKTFNKICCCIGNNYQNGFYDILIEKIILCII